MVCFARGKKGKTARAFLHARKKEKNDASWASLQISGRLVSSPKRSSLNRVERSDDRKYVCVRGLELRRLHWLVLIRRSIIFSHDIQHSAVYSLTVWSSFVSFGYSNLQQNFSRAKTKCPTKRVKKKKERKKEKKRAKVQIFLKTTT